MSEPARASVGAGDSPGPERCREIMIMLQEVTGEDGDWLAELIPATRLDGDLLLDSVEFAALSRRLADRYGASVDLVEYVASRTIDEIIALTVGDVADYVIARTSPAGSTDLSG